jgi:hypothetical protein
MIDDEKMREATQAMAKVLSGFTYREAKEIINFFMDCLGGLSESMPMTSLIELDTHTNVCVDCGKPIRQNFTSLSNGEIVWTSFNKCHVCRAKAT